MIEKIIVKLKWLVQITSISLSIIALINNPVFGRSPCPDAELDFERLHDPFELDELWGEKWKGRGVPTSYYLWIIPVKNTQGINFEKTLKSLILVKKYHQTTDPNLSCQAYPDETKMSRELFNCISKSGLKYTFDDDYGNERYIIDSNGNKIKTKFKSAEYSSLGSYPDCRSKYLFEFQLKPMFLDDGYGNAIRMPYLMLYEVHTFNMRVMPKNTITIPKF